MRWIVAIITAVSLAVAGGGGRHDDVRTRDRASLQPLPVGAAAVVVRRDGARPDLRHAPFALPELVELDVPRDAILVASPHCDGDLASLAPPAARARGPPLG